MKFAATACWKPGRGRGPTGKGWRSLALALVLASMVPANLLAQATVTTLGGGHQDRYGQPNGFVDGDTLEAAMFNAPLGMALGVDNNLWLADRDNGAIRKLLLSSGQTRTVLSNLNAPVGIAFDRGGLFYVLTAGDGTIRQYDTNLNLLATITTALASPTAFAMDSSTNFYVTEAGGTVVRVSPSSAVPVLIAAGLSSPGGITVLNNNNLAISDSGTHAIRTVFLGGPFPAVPVLFTGGNGPGLTNGNAAVAAFNNPQGLMMAPNGELIVADRGNHQVRLVKTNGYVTTFYGILPAFWTDCTGCGYNGGTVWSGWSDGPYDPSDPALLYPASKDPMGVLVTSDGTVYTTEWGYHIVRKVTGVDLTTAGGSVPGPGGTNVVVQAPTITPNSGYYPNGQVIVVGSPNPDVFYTTDGTEPTLNSARVSMVGNVGYIPWQNSLNDLTMLRVKAFIGTNGSTTVSGVAAASNSIGPSPSIRTNYTAAAGSTILVPVVMNLIPGTEVRSLFYNIEIQAAGAAPGVSELFAKVSVSTNDFLKVIGVPGEGLSQLPYGDAAGTPGGKRGLLISAVGTNLGGVIQTFGVVNLLSIPIPATAVAGNTYTVRVVYASASSDGVQTTVPVAPGGTATIVVGATSYLVGDSSPGGWYNAGEFGDGNLNIADVNNAFYASLGLRVPPALSDAFDAMDAFPVDTATWGGDGEIRFLDWQVILQRASRVDPNNYTRTRAAGGAKTVTGPFALSGSPNEGAATTTWLPGAVWVRQAQLRAGVLENVQPGQTVQVPVYLRLSDSNALTGMSLTAAVRPRGLGVPPVSGIQFVPVSDAFRPNISGNTVPGSGTMPDLLYCVWERFPSVVRGSNLIGWLSFQVPAAAAAGQSYIVRFLAGSGGEMANIMDPRTWRQPAFETIPGWVFVGVPAPTVPVRISDEWRIHFFGSPDSPLGDNEADPDQDGVPNWKEYLGGTNPIRPESLLKLQPQRHGRNVVLTWLSAPEKTYVIESTGNLLQGPWTPVTTITGNGEYRELDLGGNLPTLRFYRVRLAP